MVAGGTSQSKGTSMQSALGRAAWGLQAFRTVVEVKLLVALDGSVCGNQAAGAWQPGFVLQLLR